MSGAAVWLLLALPFRRSKHIRVSTMAMRPVIPAFITVVWMAFVFYFSYSQHRQPVDRDCDPAHGLQLSCRRFATHLAYVTGGFERRLGVLRDGRSSDEPILHDSGSGDSSALIAAPYPVTALLYTTSCQVTRESTIDHQVDPVFCGARTLQRPFTARPTGWATR